LESTSRADGVGTEENGRVSSPEPVPHNSSDANPAPPGFEPDNEHSATVRVSEVRLGDLDPADVRGFHLTRPAPGSFSDAGVIWIDGWVVGANARATAVEIALEGATVGRIPVAIPSPALVNGFPGVDWAGMAAFRGAIGPVRLPRRFQLTLVVELGGGHKVPIGVIEGERAQLPTADPANLQPIMMTGLGRSGTTWVMQLLEQHPGVSVFRPFDYEPRVAAYWTDVLAALSQPASYLQTLAAAPTPHNVWWIGEGALVPRPPKAPDPRAERWLGVSQLSALSALSTARIEAFYREVANAQRKPGARFFSEKFRPGEWTQALLWEMYPNAKEIFLVRDFRDMLTSMLAYSQKRGYGLFGRHASGSDEEFIHGNLRRDVERLRLDWRDRAEKSFLLRYEDLILQPERELTRLTQYIGVDSTDAAIAEILRAASAHRPDKQDAHKTSIGGKDSIGRWQRELSDSLRTACDEALGDALEEFGYTEERARHD
jgi:hypothetical protein